MHDSARALTNGLPPLPARIEAGGPGIALGSWRGPSHAAVLWLYRRRDGDFVTYLTLLGRRDSEWSVHSESSSGSGSFPCVDEASGEWTRFVPTTHPDYWAVEAESGTEWGEEVDGGYPHRLRVLACCAAAGIDSVRVIPPVGEDCVVACDATTGAFVFGFVGEGPAHLAIESGDAKRWLGPRPVPWQ